jgi:hypothetical protein
MFGVQIQSLPDNLSSEHFSNNQLRILYNNFPSLGNAFDDVTKFGDFIEKIYEFDTFDDFKVSPFAKETGRDGFWKLWGIAWCMRAEKEVIAGVATDEDKGFVEKFRKSNPEYFI